MARNDSINQAIGELRATGSFDESWYVSTYPDVKRTGIEPAEHYVRIGVALGRPPNGSASERSLPVRPVATSDGPSTEDLVGYVEGVSGTNIRGWAIRKTPVGKPVRVVVEVDGVYFADYPASLPRDDLAKVSAQYDGGGFEIPIPVSNTSGRQVRIDIYAAETSIPLRKSPIMVTPVSAPSRRGIRHNLLRRHANPEVAIIVPIYDALDEVIACLDSVIDKTTLPAKLILIDDASPDPRIATTLQTYEDHPNIVVARNVENLGFTRTVNRGITMAGKADVVLLNSDTEVSPRWLENLRGAAYDDFQVGTVTPFSNNAGAFSTPTLGQPNALPRWVDQDAYARLVSQSSPRLNADVPTGHGFCMYIRRECLDDVGLLDADAFPRGYGEENDFCMRASRSGWHNIIADNTIVFHAGSASFGAQKTALLQQGRKVVDERFPEYSQLTPVFRSDPKILSARHAVRRVISGFAGTSATGKPRYMYVVSTRTGGTPQTNEDLMRGVAEEIEPWLLRCDTAEMTLSRLSDDKLEEVETYQLASAVEPIAHRSDEYDDTLGKWLTDYSIELVHVRHISWHSMGLLSTCSALSIPIVFSFHDFYTICPTVKLLDGEMNYCAGTCTATETACRAELWPQGSLPPLKHQWIHRWQQLMRESLRLCDAFVTTSDHARDTILSKYPELEGKPFPVIPHGRFFDQMRDLANAPTMGERIRLLIPGNVTGPEKGSNFIAQLHKWDTQRRLEFHFLGVAPRELSGPNVFKHGPYRRDEFAQHVAKIAPHFGCVFSIWPETHCHTLTELWSVGAPVLGFDMGAVGDRIRHTGAGWLMALNDAEATVREIYRISSSVDAYDEAKLAVLTWQKQVGAEQTIDFMTSHYKDLYRQITAGKLLPSSAARRPRVALVTKGDPRRGTAPGSVHVRVWEWCRNNNARAIEYVKVDAHELLNPGRLASFNAVVIQRNSIAAEQTSALLNQCDADDIPVVFEIDDDLLNLDGDHPESVHYVEAAEPLAALASRSREVIVSTPFLRQRMLDLNSNVRVVENKLSARLWFAPLDDTQHEGFDVPEYSGVRLLFMGSETHERDLAMLRTPLQSAQADGHAIELFVVGGQPERADWYTNITVPGHVKNYTSFVPWFRRIADSMDIGVAPLVDTTFNRSKSGLKFLEYAAGGLSGLFSDVESYQNLVKRSECGRLVRNSPAEWQAALSDATDDVLKFKQQGRAARDWVQRHHCVEDHIADFDAGLLELIGS